MVISLPESTRLDVYVACDFCDGLFPERVMNKHLYIHRSHNKATKGGRLSVFACVNITNKVPVVAYEFNELIAAHFLQSTRGLPKTVIVNFDAPKTLSSTLFDNNDHETEPATTSSSSQVPYSNRSLSRPGLKTKSKWAQYLSRQIPKRSKRNGKQRQIVTTKVDKSSDFGQESIRRKIAATNRSILSAQAYRLNAMKAANKKSSPVRLNVRKKLERYDILSGLLPPETEPVWPEPEPIDFERTSTTDQDRVVQKPEIVAGEPLSDLSSVKIEAAESDDVHLQTLHIPPIESPVSSSVQIKTEPTADINNEPTSSLSPEQQEIDSVLRPHSAGDSSSHDLCSAAIQMTHDGEVSLSASQLPISGQTTSALLRRIGWQKRSFREPRVVSPSRIEAMKRAKNHSYS